MEEKKSPPKLFLKFFRWYCHPQKQDYIEGDLMELYNRRLKESGKKEADWKFIVDVLMLFRPGIIRPRKNYQKINTTDMYKNYIKIGWRNLTRNKEYAVINIAGLALSLTCGIVIFTLITHYLSFEDFHQNPEQTYRIVTEMRGTTDIYSSGVPTPLGGLLREEQTFWKHISRIFIAPNVLLTIPMEGENLKFKEVEGITFVETEFFKIFNFPLVKGNLNNPLNEPNTALLTERLAEKYFGDTDPIGQSLVVDNNLTLTVTGVLENFPSNTGFQSEVLVSYETFQTYMPWLAGENFWGGISGNLQCYALIDPSTSTSQVEQILATYAQNYPVGRENEITYSLQPIAEMQFNTQYGGSMNKNNLLILAAIGVFLLLTACVNFINLATAKALKRSKEIGVRKVMGSFRGQIFWQFIFETGILAILSVAFALLATVILLPSVNSLFSTELSHHLFLNWNFLLFILGLTGLITLLAGCYPAIILAGFKPITALKGNMAHQHVSGFNTRRTLIVSQFVISQVLIISLIVVMNQMHYARQSDLGFEKDRIVMVNMGTNDKAIKGTLKNEFLRLPEVDEVSLCENAPATRNVWETDVKLNPMGDDLDFLTTMKLVDEAYIATFNIELLSGRNLLPSDTVREVLVNEALLQRLQIATPDEAIGRMIYANGGNMSGPIVGVVKNFHDKSFHEEISPAIFTTDSRRYSNFAIKLNPQADKTILNQIETTWQANYPDQLFEYSYLDESIAKFYETEETILTSVKLFSFIAIFIGCLGLYGLVSFMVAQKTKEIGIRKVLGGSVNTIIWLFGQEFTRLILIAFVIATPIGWYLMRNWLQDFQFSIQLDVWTFGIAIACSFLIAAFTVGYQVFRAALNNPAVSLKTE